MAQLELAHPGRLAALLVLPILVFIAYRYAPLGAGWQRIASLVCRLTLVTLLVVALAGPLYRHASGQRYVVFAVDESASVSAASRDAASAYIEAARKSAGSNLTTIVRFADRPDGFVVDESTVGGLDPLASDPAAAVLAAAASIPADFVPDVVLLTDGRQTNGDLLHAAQHAGMPVSVVPLPAFAEPEVCVASVGAPQTARPGEQLSFRIVIEANGENAGHVELYRDSERVASQPLTLSAGETRLTLRAEFGHDKEAKFEARLVGFQDKVTENNVAAAVVYAAPPIQALIVDQEEPRGQRLAAVLNAQGIAAAVKKASDLPAALAELQKYDVLVLSDVAGNSISDSQTAAIKSHVSGRGGGLVVVGGSATFGSQVYQGSHLEPLLPVAALARSDERKTSLALTLIIDRSTSMQEENRLGLAKEAARQVVELLTPQDKVGVIAFGSDSQWISEIYPCSDKPELLRRIATLQAGGQTDMYPALAKAYLAMDQIDADRRHVILLTDANYAYPGDFQQIAVRMAAAGVTMSTVSISKGAEQTILKDISRAAKGRHYHCDDPKDVPSILVRETKSVAVAAASEFRPLVFRQLPGLDIATAPPLRESVAISPKPRAELLLIGAEGDPLLSWWRYGDGVSMALAANVQEHWSTWPGYDAFWERLIRHAARDSTPREFTFELDRVANEGFATLNAIAPDGTFLNGARVQMSLIAMTGGIRLDRTIPVRRKGSEATVIMSLDEAFPFTEVAQVAPGRYQTQFNADEPGTWTAHIWVPHPTDSDNALFETSRTLEVAYHNELRVGPADEALLRAVASVSGGAYDPPAEAVFAPTDRTTQRSTPLGWYLVLAAALVLVADVAARRYHECFGGSGVRDRLTATRSGARLDTASPARSAARRG